MNKIETAAQLDLDNLEALARAATPGPWAWWTSNSMVRLTGADGRDGGVLYGSAHRGYGDVNCAPNDQAFIAAANPATILALIAQARAQPAAELIAAADAVVERWHSRDWKEKHTRDFINRLAAAVGNAKRAQPAAIPINPSVNSGEGVPSVKTWKERCGDTGLMPSMDDAMTAMKAEIADLRAQLSQQRQAAPHVQAAPVAVMSPRGRPLVWRPEYANEPWSRDHKPLCYCAAPAPKEAEQASATVALEKAARICETTEGGDMYGDAALASAAKQIRALIAPTTTKR